MFVKTIGTLLLLGFFYVQLGTSLDCYSCDSPTGCRSPSKITCNSGNANTTTDHLHFYFKENLTSLASTNFDCFFHNYTSVQTNITYKGCIHRAIAPCALTFKDTFPPMVRTACNKCGGNLCNGSPAGTFSSSLVSMFASILVIAIYKVLNM